MNENEHYEPERENLERVLSEHDALAPETEKKIVDKAIPQKQPQKLNSFKFTTVDELADIIRFQYPKAAFMDVVNLDELDPEGFPKLSHRKLRGSTLTYQSNRNQILSAYIAFDSVVCLVKKAVVGVRLAHFASDHTNNSYY